MEVTSNLTFIITWQEGNTEREEVLIKGLGSRATFYNALFTAAWNISTQ